MGKCFRVLKYKLHISFRAVVSILFDCKHFINIYIYWNAPHTCPILTNVIHKLANQKLGVSVCPKNGRQKCLPKNFQKSFTHPHVTSKPV